MADQKEEKSPVNAVVSDIGMDVTAVFANRVAVTMNALTTRILVGVGNPGSDSNFHTAVVMPTGDALELARLILSLFELNPSAKAVQTFLSSEEYTSLPPARSLGTKD